MNKMLGLLSKNYLLLRCENDNTLTIVLLYLLI